MSIDATKWAWAVKTSTPSQKLVLLSMADRAGEDHTCYPSTTRLEHDTGLSRRSVINAIDALEAQGLIKFTGRTVGTGVKVYHLVGVNGRTDSHQNDTTDTQNVAKNDVENATQDDQNPCNFCTPANSAPVQFLHPTRAIFAPHPCKICTPPVQNLHPEPSLNYQGTINEFIYTPKNQKNPKTRKNSTVTAKPKNQGKDFEFTDNQKSKCQAHGLDIHGQFEQFKNYHEAKGSKWKDWSRAFDYWLNNAVNWSKSSQPTTKPHNQTQGQHHAPHSQPQPIKPNSDAEYALIRDQRNAELRAMGYPIS